MHLSEWEATSLEEWIWLARNTMHRKIKRCAEKRNENVKHFQFQLGDAVLVRANNVSSEKHIAKFFYVYEGPHFIKESVGTDTYLLSHSSNEIRGKFHLSLLKPYYSRSFENKDWKIFKGSQRQQRIPVAYTLWLANNYHRANRYGKSKVISV